MISLVITINKPTENIMTRHGMLTKIFGMIKEDYEIVLVVREDNLQLNELRDAVRAYPQHRLVVLDSSANKNCQVYAGIDATSGGAVLLAEGDTTISAIEKLLIMYKAGSENVHVREKENFFLRFFSWMGSVTYNAGLKLLRKGRDELYSLNIELLDGRVADLICLNPESLQHIQAEGRFEQIKTERVAIQNLSANNGKQPETAPARALGVVSVFYLIALLMLAVIYPATHDGAYTWWIFTALAVWIGLGILALSYITKQMLEHRFTAPAADKDGDLNYKIIEFFDYAEIQGAQEKPAEALNENSLQSMAKSAAKVNTVKKPAAKNKITANKKPAAAKTTTTPEKVKSAKTAAAQKPLEAKTAAAKTAKPAAAKLATAPPEKTKIKNPATAKPATPVKPSAQNTAIKTAKPAVNSVKK